MVTQIWEFQDFSFFNIATLFLTAYSLHSAELKSVGIIEEGLNWKQRQRFVCLEFLQYLNHFRDMYIVHLFETI